MVLSDAPDPNASEPNKVAVKVKRVLVDADGDPQGSLVDEVPQQCEVYRASDKASRVPVEGAS